MTGAGFRRLTLALLCALGGFSLVFTQLAQAGRWPATPSGFLHDSDLWIGIAVGVVLLVLMIARPARQRAMPGVLASPRPSDTAHPPKAAAGHPPPGI